MADAADTLLIAARGGGSLSAPGAVSRHACFRRTCSVPRPLPRDVAAMSASPHHRRVSGHPPESIFGA
jgi:hypothetical protein